MRISGQDVDFLTFADAVIDLDIYFQYLRMWMQMLKVMWISGQDVDFLIFADVDIDADIYFQYLQMQMQMQMLKII